MAVAQCGIIYKNGATGVQWAEVQYQELGTPAALFALMDTWNTATCAIRSENIVVVSGWISDVDVYRDMFYFDASEFTTPGGTVPDEALPDGVVALLAVSGSATNQGQGRVRFGGIAESLSQPGGIIDVTAAPWTTLRTQALIYCKQYRPVATPAKGLPVVDPPEVWGSGFWRNTLYTLRRGRSFRISGQQR